MTFFFAGFSAWLVQYLVYLKELPVWAINLIVSTLTATMTEVVSNTATANILLPILKEMSLTLCYNPVYMGETRYLDSPLALEYFYFSTCGTNAASFMVVKEKCLCCKWSTSVDVV